MSWIRVLESMFGLRATTVISKILHPFKYPGLGVMSTGKMKIYNAICLLIEIAKVATLVTRPQNLSPGGILFISVSDRHC